MTDIVDKATRSKMMSEIRGKNTKPELLIRKKLHQEGFRYRLHVKDLPGKPDIVLPRYRAVIFVHGCFWHAHNCKLFKLPASNTEFWQQKMNQNRRNDQEATNLLLKTGWRVATIWECAIRGKNKNINEVIKRVIVWLQNSELLLEEKE